MRLLRTILIAMVLVFVAGCKTNTVYVPVNNTHTEYKDKIVRDSIHLHDSVFMKVKGDTVLLEKYKYLYRDRLVRDSIFKTDSISVPYPVVETKEVYKQTTWQIVCSWFGKVFMALIGIGLIVLVVKWKLAH
jgi:hypothetical protein